MEYSPVRDSKKNLPLHKYGSGPFCRFKINPDIDGLGVYCIADGNNKPLYIGKCTGATSTLLKRFNQGYGSIQPRNCYKGGQSTNCRINQLVLDAVKKGKKLLLFFHKTKNGQEATKLEADLIKLLKPPWDIK